MHLASFGWKIKQFWWQHAILRSHIISCSNQYLSLPSSVCFFKHLSSRSRITTKALNNPGSCSVLFCDNRWDKWANSFAICFCVPILFLLLSALLCCLHFPVCTYNVQSQWQLSRGTQRSWVHGGWCWCACRGEPPITHVLETIIFCLFFWLSSYSLRLLHLYSFRDNK